MRIANKSESNNSLAKVVRREIFSVDVHPEGSEPYSSLDKQVSGCTLISVKSQELLLL